jgi:hypothetical protein
MLSAIMLSVIMLSVVAPHFVVLCQGSSPTSSGTSRLGIMHPFARSLRKSVVKIDPVVEQACRFSQQKNCLKLQRKGNIFLDLCDEHWNGKSMACKNYTRENYNHKNSNSNKM